VLAPQSLRISEKARPLGWVLQGECGCLRTGFVCVRVCAKAGGWVHVTCQKGEPWRCGEEGLGACGAACARRARAHTWTHMKEHAGWATHSGKGCACVQGRTRQTKGHAGGQGQTPGPSPGCRGSQASPPVGDSRPVVPGSSWWPGRFAVPGAMRDACMQGQECSCKRRGGTCSSMASP